MRHETDFTRWRSHFRRPPLQDAPAAADTAFSAAAKEDWIARGGRWIAYTSRPDLGGDKAVAQSGQKLFDYFSARPGFTNPLLLIPRAE